MENLLEYIFTGIIGFLVFGVLVIVPAVRIYDGFMRGLNEGLTSKK